MITETTYNKLRELDPSDVEFHAARYESGSLFQEAIEAANEHEFVAGRMIVEMHLQEALEATPGDGGNHGVIPCLGGVPNDVWWDWQAGR